MKKFALIIVFVVMGYSERLAQCERAAYQGKGQYIYSCNGSEYTIRFDNGKVCSFSRIEITHQKGKGFYFNGGLNTPDGRRRDFSMSWRGRMAEWVICFDYRKRDDGRGTFWLYADGNEVLNLEYNLTQGDISFFHTEPIQLDINIRR